jgi:hypothetical protein
MCACVCGVNASILLMSVNQSSSFIHHVEKFSHDVDEDWRRRFPKTRSQNEIYPLII